jgi:DtxR family Mn-dependent transcriptional regulator
MEMYLKTILEIADGGDAPRVKAIAERLGVTMPSVSGAVDTLQRRGLVEHTPYGAVRLTSKGSRVAREVKDRNELIYQFLLEVLQLPESIASRDACVLEHVVSPKTLERISVFLEFTRACPRTGDEALAHFAKWLSHPGARDVCPACENEGGGR